jgi:hypothetical protein
MVVKPISQRVTDAFDDGTLASFGSDYLGLALERWSEVVRLERRTATLMIVVGVGFVLLAGAEAAEFTLGPLKLTNVHSILVLGPVILSFLFYELLLFDLAELEYKAITDSLMGRLHPTIRDNDLHFALAPATPAVWGKEPERSLSAAESRSLRTLDRLNSGISAVLAFGTLIFLAYTFVHLYGDAHTSALAVTVALGVTCFNVLRGLLLATSS